MVDRILHIGYKLSDSYNKELVQRAAEVSVYKGADAVVPYLVTKENMAPAEAETLAQKIEVLLRKLNRSVLLQYGIGLLIFASLLIAGLFSQSYIFAGVNAIPMLLLLRSLFKFVRRNRL